MICLQQKRYSQKHLDHDKKSARDGLKTALKRAIQKDSEATGDLMGNKIADKITRVLKTPPQNTSEANEEKILIKIYAFRTKT